MFVEKTDNDRLARDFWQGKPSGKLLWSFDPGRDMTDFAKKNGYDNPTTFMQKEFGVLVWGTGVDPTDLKNEDMYLSKNKTENITEIKYQHSAGLLTETLKNGQIIKHKVNSTDELNILIEMLRTVEVTSDTELYNTIRKNDQGKWPIFLTTDMSSAVQHFIQRETGVENFWFLTMDCPELMEEAMELWQNILKKKYDIMKTLPCDGFYQGENTSTTMISPNYYKKYSLNHIRQFTSAAHEAGVRALVHMCGLLKDLMPLFGEAEIDGIHALSPPSIGNTPFEYAYKIMPEKFFALGRFGSLHWINRSVEEIIKELSVILPHYIYKDRAFILLVTADDADFSYDDLRRLRDAINMYECII